MTLVCIQRPNRTERRTFTASDVGRIACHAIEAGVSRETIIKELNKRCPEMDVCDRVEIKQSIVNVIGVLLGVLVVLLIPAEAFAAAVVAGLVILSRILPFLLRSKIVQSAQKLLQQLPKIRLEINEAIKALERIAN